MSAKTPENDLQLVLCSNSLVKRTLDLRDVTSSQEAIRTLSVLHLFSKQRLTLLMKFQTSLSLSLKKLSR